MLEVCSASALVILICLKIKAAEYLEALVEELAIEYEPHEPESSILLQNLLMYRRRDLNLTVHRDR